MPAIPISHVLPRETFAPAWEDSEFDRSVSTITLSRKQISIRCCHRKNMPKNTTRISVCYLYFLRFHAGSAPWETNEKHSTILSLGRPVPVQRPFSRDNLLYRVNQCWFVVITWPLKARELQSSKKRTTIFFNFLEFSILQRKNFLLFYKKKIPSNFIDKFPLIHFIIARINVIICHWISENWCSQWREFFFQISHASHFQRKLCASLTKISLNFRSSIYDYFLYRIVDLPFSYPIEYQKITFDEGKRSHLLAARGFS